MATSPSIIADSIYLMIRTRQVGAVLPRRDGSTYINPLYKELNGNAQNPPADGGFTGMIQQLRQFAGGFQGDPQQELQKMLSSGQMNQSQYNQLQNVAQRIASMLPH